MSKPKLKNALKSRSSIRWKGHDYGSAGLYFITICCQDRMRWLGEVTDGKMRLNPLGEIVAQEWQATNKKRSNVKLHEYVIMPDHIHGIIEIIFPIHSSKDEVKFSSPKNTIGSIIRGFKSATTVQILDCISNQKMHWRRGELTFAQKASTNASPTRRGELTFATRKSHASPSRRGELIFAHEQTFMTKPQFKLWQRGYHDRVIRNLDELKSIIRYISENPMRWSYKMNEDTLM